MEQLLKARYMNSREIAELLNMNTRTVQRMLSTGEIPAYKFKKEYRARECDVEQWIRDQKVTPVKEKESE